MPLFYLPTFRTPQVPSFSLPIDVLRILPNHLEAKNQLIKIHRSLGRRKKKVIFQSIKYPPERITFQIHARGIIFLFTLNLRETWVLFVKASDRRKEWCACVCSCYIIKQAYNLNSKGCGLAGLLMRKEHVKPHTVPWSIYLYRWLSFAKQYSFNRYFIVACWIYLDRLSNFSVKNDAHERVRTLTLSQSSFNHPTKISTIFSSKNVPSLF